MNRYPDSYAFRMALEQRLKNRADETGVELDRLRRYAAFEAFLARLFASEKTHWALKGALALEYRLDLQLLGRTKSIQPREIAATITTVFTHEPLPIPKQFPKPPASWRVTYRDLAAQQQLATDLEEAHADVGAWLNEALQLVQG